MAVTTGSLIWSALNTCHSQERKTRAVPSRVITPEKPNTMQLWPENLWHTKSSLGFLALYGYHLSVIPQNTPFPTLSQCQNLHPALSYHKEISNFIPSTAKHWSIFEKLNTYELACHPQYFLFQKHQKVCTVTGVAWVAAHRAIAISGVQCGTPQWETLAAFPCPL